MKILFDQGTPVPLRRSLPNHDIATAFELGWQLLHNGELMRAAEAQDFAALITTDQNLRQQQSLEGSRLAILVLMTTDWHLIRQHLDYVRQAIAGLAPGAYLELPFPPR